MSSREFSTKTNPRLCELLNVRGGMLLRGWTYLERLREARKILELAFEELERYRRDREVLRLRDACEKGWLAVVLATDTLLVSLGFRKPESYSERGEGS